MSRRFSLFSMFAALGGGLLLTSSQLAQQPPATDSRAVEPEIVVVVEGDDDEGPLPEQPVLDSAAKYVEAYNKHDIDAIVDAYTPDADVVTVKGDRLSGHDEIRAAVIGRFEENPEARISLSINSIRMIADNVAVEEGEGIFFADGEHAASSSLYTIIHTLEDGQWRMVFTRNIKDQPISAHERLQPLAWLVGDWIDEGADSVIENNCRWSDDQSFLITDYSVIRDGETVLKGTQRIGWDPQANRIRSWAFDEGGGFNEATWANIDDHWVVRTSGVSADGSSGSMTRTLRPVGPDRYTLTISDRLAGDESLPDIEVSLVRKAPAPQSAAE